MVLPAWSALIVHVPVATNVTVVPLTVHFVGVVVEKVTSRPEVDDALTLNGASASVLLDNAPNVIVWSSLVTVKLWLTVGAALYVESPAWSALTVHVPP